MISTTRERVKPATAWQNFAAGIILLAAKEADSNEPIVKTHQGENVEKVRTDARDYLTRKLCREWCVAFARGGDCCEKCEARMIAIEALKGDGQQGEKEATG